MIEGDYLYVDKTKDIYNLITDGGQYYFLSRPRRFGKSLLISTLKELFSGNESLFKGLWIHDKWTWEKYPVIHLDFLGLDSGSREELIDSLEFLVNRNADRYGIKLKEKNYNTRFKELVAQLAKTGPVVILIDEYDKPIINNLDDLEVAKGNRKILKTFYETVKESDPHLKFVFITGVSKFSRVSVFSGLNNLTDLTIDDHFSTITGYTQEELNHHFSDRITMLAKKFNKEEAVLLQEIKAWYNGYSWDGSNFVYNPYSILSFFRAQKLKNYWFVSGTPSFLVQMIKSYSIDVRELDGYRAGEGIFESFDLERMDVYALLFQTGYLTIKSIPEDEIYLLSYPNREVKKSFMEHLLAEFSGRFAREISVLTHDLRNSLQKGEMEKFITTASVIFSGISYDMFVKDKEGYYQTVVSLMVKLVGIDIETEVETNQGRIDAVIKTDNIIYVIEFKLGTAETALAQIKAKKYYEKYLSDGKTVHIIGIGFDPEERNISGYLMETVS
ncbi:MAG: ATP-binding protein [bacterium]|nr:ATP-binding protein [bacterium]